MVETPVASTIWMTQKGMQNIPTLQALLWPAWQKSLFDPPQPKLAVFQAVFGLLILLRIQIVQPYLSMWMEEKSLLSPLWPQISHYLHSLLFPNPLLPWTADVFLLQSNSWAAGKEIKIVLGKAELNSTSQFQAKKLLTLMFYKLYSQSPFKIWKPPKSSFK